VTDDGFVGVDPVRQRIKDLNALGITFAAIAEAAGLNRRYVHQLLTHKTQWTTLEVQEAIYSIPIPVGHHESEWFDQALCKGTPLDAWFVDEPASTIAEHHQHLEQARSLCSNCPVTQPCLAYAIRHSAVGIWAGTTEAERHHLKGTQNEHIKVPEP